MNSLKISALFLLVLFTCSRVLAQPSEVVGSETNLAALIQPVPLDAKFSDPDYYIWCGTLVKGDDAKYHLFYSRWPRRLGFHSWVTHSEIAHAVGDTPVGPFKHYDVALPPRGKEFWDGLCTHNPTIHRFGDQYYLYYMGNTGDGVATKGELNWTHRNNQRIGVAVAKSPNGPWTRMDRPIVDVSPANDAPDSLMASNPAVCARPDGGFLLVYKAVGRQRPMPFGGPVVHLTATADSPTGPFTKQLQPTFTAPGAAFPTEDPFIWFDRSVHRYRAIVKDQNGYFTPQRGRSLILWESLDGFAWKLAANPMVTTTEILWADGRKQPMHYLERPQLFFEHNRPAVLLAAVGEVAGMPSSYNIQIPLLIKP